MLGARSTLMTISDIYETCYLTGGRSVTVQEAVILEVGCWLGAFKKGRIMMMQYLG